MYSCSVTTKIALLVAIGLGFALTGLLCYLFLPFLIEYNVKQKLVLSPNSMTFDGWHKVSIPIYTKFYIFNVTNPEQVLDLQKPILEELGPYTFRESREKVDIIWNNNNGTVSYKQIRRWNFISEKTNGSLEDSVVHLNVPMISAGNEIRRKYSGEDLTFFYGFVNSINEETNSTLFNRHTVRELLFEGYEEIILEAAKQLFPKTPYTKFGWFYGKNNTSSDGTYSIFTGENGINRLGLMNSWNNEFINNKWFGKECQTIDDSSGGDFQPPYRNPKPKSIKIFIGDICRSLSLDFAHEVNYKGIKCDRYWANPSLFDYNLNENKCYCGTNSCPANGVLNISSCTLGSPSAVSFPHFLYADNIYSNKIEGLNPNPIEHSFYMDFENTLGIPLNIAARMQINIVLEQNDELEFSSNMTQKEIYFPQFWFSSSANVDDDMIEQLDFLINGVPYYICLISFLFVFIGCLTLLSTTVYAYRSKRTLTISKRQKYEAVEVISTSFTN